MVKARSAHYDIIYKLVSEGYRITEIREALQNAVSRQRVAQLRDEIIQANPHFQKIFEDRQKQIYEQQVKSIKELINDCSVPDIAAMLEISKSSIYRIIQDEKIVKTRNPKPPMIEKGSIYGLWQVGEMIERRDTSNQLVRYYLCTCMGCGKENQEVRQSNLLGGLSQSCQECGYRRRSQNKND